MQKTKHGFSLIEVMIVVGIISILLIAVLFAVRLQRSKADDAKTKSDLNRLKIAFEDYYSDHNCYPPAEWFNGPEDCGSHVLAPYLNTLTCDRATGLPYTLETDNTGCTWFKLTGTLNNAEPYPGCLSSSCATTTAYHVSSGNINPYPAYAANAVPSPTPDPHASSSPVLPYYCQSADNCTSFDRVRFICTPSFSDPHCGGSCVTSVGTCRNR